MLKSNVPLSELGLAWMDMNIIEPRKSLIVPLIYKLAPDFLKLALDCFFIITLKSIMQVSI